MGNPYTSQSASGYNTSPPPDDGTQSEANRTKYATVKTKLADPVKTLADGINTAIVSAFTKIALNNVSVQSGDYTVQSSDQGALIDVTGAATITTPAAATVAVPFMFAVRNDHSASITIDGNGSETIDGNATLTLPPNNGVLLATDGTNWFTATTVGPTISDVQDQTFTYYADSGAADAYVITPSPAITAYGAGQRFTVKATNANTGAATIDVNGLGAQSILSPDNQELLASDIAAAGIFEIVYDGTNFIFVSQLNRMRLRRGYIDGLILSNNGTDADHDIDIAAGVCRDSGNAVDMELTSTLVKQLDAAWAVGTNAGGLDTGGIAADTWYHMWLIRRSDTGVVDALFSTSATTPTMPASPWDQKRRIGAVLTDASSNIIAFFQDGDVFYWDVVVQDRQTTNPGTSALLTTHTVPTGVMVWAWASWGIVETSGGLTYALITSPDQTDTIPSSTLHNIINSGSVGTNATAMRVRTDTSAQTRFRVDRSDTDMTIAVNTIGWVDPRGKDS